MILWTYKEFGQLSPVEIYDILRLRSEVFVVEQNCVFLDMDNKDQACGHLMGVREEDTAAGNIRENAYPDTHNTYKKENKLVAYARIVPPGISYEESSIGRIVTSPSERQSGFGRALLAESISALYRIHGQRTIRIGAQLYLKKFYSSFGFIQSGEIYLEDGIQHIEMILPHA